MEQYDTPRTTADSNAEGRMKADVATKRKILKKHLAKKMGKVC